MCACVQDRLSRDYRAPPHLIVSHRSSPLQQHHLIGIDGERYRLPAARKVPRIQFKYLDIDAIAVNSVLGYFTKVSGLRNHTAESRAISGDLVLGMHTQ